MPSTTSSLRLRQRRLPSRRSPPSRSGRPRGGAGTAGQGRRWSARGGPGPTVCGSTRGESRCSRARWRHLGLPDEGLHRLLSAMALIGTPLLSSRGYIGPQRFVKPLDRVHRRLGMRRKTLRKKDGEGSCRIAGDVKAMGLQQQQRQQEKHTCLDSLPGPPAREMPRGCPQAALAGRRSSEQGGRHSRQHAAKQAGRQSRLATRLAQGARPGAAMADRAALLSSRLWAEVVAPAMMGQEGAALTPSSSEKKALRQFFVKAVKEDVSETHVTSEVARPYALDKWAARCDKQCCALLSLADSARWPHAELGDTLRVASVGGGPGNDAYGTFVFATLLRRWCKVEAAVFDFSSAWQPLCDAIAEPSVLADCALLLAGEINDRAGDQESRVPCEYTLGFHLADLRAPASAAVNEKLLEAAPDMDLFLFSFVVRESQACRYDLLPTLFRRSRKGAAFVFLDMHVTDLVPVQELVERLQCQETQNFVFTGDDVQYKCSFESVRLGCSEQYPFFGLAFLKVS
ncbi:unnamed protein product [Prorocentrum cordatum]|uniref:Uncharacterized protein n=1 Tax=Prorocentrum cordatum TaxID=2364126 RepID=A0ABN9VJW3_9DINO|nr:unnamed protein product [Polarella glacialis]